MRKVHILYTEEEGGNFQYLAKETDQKTRDFYELCVKSRMIDHQTGSKLIKIRPNLILLVENTKEFDTNAPITSQK